MHLAKEPAWKSIIDSDIPLPTPRINLYHEDGNFISHKQFPTVVNANTAFHMEEQFSACSAEPEEMYHNIDDAISAYSTDKECSLTECALTECAQTECARTANSIHTATKYTK